MLDQFQQAEYCPYLLGKSIEWKLPIPAHTLHNFYRPYLLGKSIEWKRRRLCGGSHDEVTVPTC